MEAEAEANIILISKEGTEFSFKAEILDYSETIKHAPGVEGGDNRVPTPTLTSAVLTKITEYFEMHDYAPV